MNPSLSELEAGLASQLRAFALTRRPNTMYDYRNVAARFLSYLQANFPEVRHPDQLRRQPHLLSWLSALGEQQPPLSSKTRSNLLICLRRLLDDLAPDLFRPEDFPRLPHYLPRPLSADEDRLLQQQLHRTDDLDANALLLTRASGVRIGECIDLSLDCLRQIGPDRWVLHVPLGKLNTERVVPASPDIRHYLARITTLRASEPPSRLAHCQAFLLPRGGRGALYDRLRAALSSAAQSAGCLSHVTPHRLRHTFASEMVRLGVSLPALMQLLGHRDIRMSLRYVQVTAQDLDREFMAARHRAAQRYDLPALPLAPCSPHAGLPGIQQALAAVCHLLEMYRRQLADKTAQSRLSRLARRLRTVSRQLEILTTPEK
jgi:site-specific recombinase XerD